MDPIQDKLAELNMILGLVGGRIEDLPQNMAHWQKDLQELAAKRDVLGLLYKMRESIDMAIRIVEKHHKSKVI